MQDKATLRSDLSGIQGYTGAALSVLLFFFAPVETQSDKPRGLRGRAPSSSPDGGSRETEKTMAKNTHLRQHRIIRQKELSCQQVAFGRTVCA